MVHGNPGSVLLKQSIVAGWGIEGRSRLAVGVFALLCLDALAGGFSVAMLLPLVNAMLGTVPPPGPIAMLYGAVEGLARVVGATMGPAFLVFFFSVVLLIKAALSLLTQIATTWFGQTLLRDWRERLFGGYIGRDLSIAQAELRGHAVNVITREAPQAHGYVLNMIGLAANGLTLLVQLTLMTIVNAQLVAIGVAVGVFIYFALFRYLVKTSHRLGLRTLEKSKSMVERFVQTLSNLRDVQLLQIENRKVGEMRSDNKALYRAEMRFGLVRAAPAIAVEMLFALGIAVFGLAIAVQSGSSVNHLLTEAVFFIAATYRLLGSISAMATDWVRIANRRSSFDALMTELRRFHASPLLTKGRTVRSLDTDVEIRELSYSTSQGMPIFKAASAIIPRGQITVLFGPSGSGKTTLLDLISRLHEPPAATIVANGQDVTLFERTSWMRLFGYVSQEPTLFADTLYNNVALGRPGVGDQEVQWALNVAAVSDFVDGRSDPNQIWLEENGANLSGGQRRRVAIARALVTRPAVLMLDEATQAVEIAMERDFLRRLSQIGTTVLIVSHRLETADFADHILFLKEGSLSVVQSKTELEIVTESQLHTGKE